jgi:hypothetical protein
LFGFWMVFTQPSGVGFFSKPFWWKCKMCFSAEDNWSISSGPLKLENLCRAQHCHDQTFRFTYNVCFCFVFWVINPLYLSFSSLVLHFLLFFSCPQPS